MHLVKLFEDICRSIPLSLSGSKSNPFNIDINWLCRSCSRPTGSAPSNRQRMLQDIQAELYSTVVASDIDEINEWLNSAPIQESVPNKMTAEQDIKWLMAWWRTNRFKYPRMAKIARRYLSVPASEVGVERLFSRGRDLQAWVTSICSLAGDYQDADGFESFPMQQALVRSHPRPQRRGCRS